MTTQSLTDEKSNTTANGYSDGRRIGTAIAAGAALLGAAGCDPIRNAGHAFTGQQKPDYAPVPKGENAETARRVLNRVAFGARPGDIAHVANIGAAAYLEDQLADRMPENLMANWRVNALDVRQDTENEPDTLDSLPDSQLLIETQQAAILRAVYSTHQLRETLSDFWCNHFNLYALKNDERVLIPTDTERVIRPHVLGKFHEMLLASAHSPAMLSYLDNQLNRRGGANENYARELLELHTLGVNSGYTQHDIQEVARCFTGWRVRKGFERNVLKFDLKKDLTQPYNGYVYDATLHDDGAKVVPFLNLHLTPYGGKGDADAVLERLAYHPATARFLAAKLCRRYLGSTPPATVEAAANSYLKHDTDIRALLRPILLDALLVPQTGRQPMLKRPLEFTVSALRTLAADTDGGVNVQTHLTAMGQPLYQWPMPDGYPEKPSAWTGSLLPRWNFAFALAANGIDGTTLDLNALLRARKANTDTAQIDALMETVLNRPADTSALRSLREQIGRHVTAARQTNVPPETVTAEATGLILASPAFQWR